MTENRKIFFDMEFTGLHQKTTPISIGLVADYPNDNGVTFYAEFTDYDVNQVDDWLKTNVIDKLENKGRRDGEFSEEIHHGHWFTKAFGDKEFVAKELKIWLKQFDKIEFWSDCLSYDWVLLSELIADYSTGYPVFPDNVAFYCPFDIVTLAKVKGIDPDFSRSKMAGVDKNQEHNALADAQTIKKCYHHLISL